MCITSWACISFISGSFAFATIKAKGPDFVIEPDQPGESVNYVAGIDP
jgi:hypothetical protein